MNNIITQENIAKWITVFDGLSQKLRRTITPSDYLGINKMINVFFRAFGLTLSFGMMIFGFILIAEAMIFLKAKRKSWAVVIPFYNDYVMFDIATGKGFLGIIYSLIVYSIMFLPVFELICDFDIGLLKIFMSCVSLVLVVFMKFKLAKKFNKGIIFGLGLLLLPIIFYPILGFGKSEYKPENEINKIEDKKNLV